MGIVSFGVGVGVGYLVGKRRKNVPHELPIQLEFDLQKEDIEPEPAPPAIDHQPVIIDREVYEQLPPVVDDDLRDIVAQADELAAEYQGDPEDAGVEEIDLELGDGSETEVDDEPEEILVTRSVFTEVDAVWDWEIENEHRAGLENGEPYVLHIEEYRSNTSGMDQQDLTWYEQDEVLADSHGLPIEPRELNIGELKWGHGSGDPNVFYVRVPRNKMEFEVLRSTGSFHLVVLGMAAEDAAEAEARRPPRRQRLED